MFPSILQLYRTTLRNSCGSSLSCFIMKHTRFSDSTMNFLRSSSNCFQNDLSVMFINQKRFGSASAAISSGAVPGVLSKKQAKELAMKLTSDERQVLISALQECQSLKLKAEYEGKEY